MSVILLVTLFQLGDVDNKFVPTSHVQVQFFILQFVDAAGDIV